MPHRTTLAAAAALAAMGTAACSPTESAPAPEPTTPPTTSTASVPEVQNPKNLAGITDACQLLTPEQLVSLAAGTEAIPDTTAYDEPKCSWRNDDFRMTVALNATTGTEPAKIYEDGKSSDNFEPSRVGEYPAARVDAQENLCHVEVGVAEAESFTVNYSKRGGDAPEMQSPWAMPRRSPARC